jgi:tight adherence protein C
MRAPAVLRSFEPPWSAAPDVVARGIAESGLTPGEVPALRVGAALAFGAVGLVGGFTIGGVLGLIAAAGLPAFGALYPDIWLRTESRRRAERIERRAPLVLDLVAATVTAGIDLDTALRGATAACSEPLRAELQLVAANIDLGRPRREELRASALRTGSPSLAGLALAVSLSDRLGAPLAETLEAQARRARIERGRAVQERAAAAGPKVLVVVVFVLVPAALVPLVAAVALTVAGAVGGSGW